MILSKKNITALKSIIGGNYSRDVVIALGGNWEEGKTLKRGWYQSLIGREISDDTYFEAEMLSVQHNEMLKRAKIYDKEQQRIERMHSFPATEKQINLLLDLGVTELEARSLSKLEACTRIQEIFDKPTKKQIAFLKANHFTDKYIATLTKDQATAEIKEFIKADIARKESKKVINDQKMIYECGNESLWN